MGNVIISPERTIRRQLSKACVLVKWRGYSHDENTWETYENVSENSTDMWWQFCHNNPTIERDGRFGKMQMKKNSFLFLYFVYVYVLLCHCFGTLSGIFYYLLVIMEHCGGHQF